jgi:hypothetical protein
MMQRRRVNPEDNETETLDFNKPSFTFKPNGHHSYRQVGYYLVCKSCVVEHAVWIGPDKILCGFDDKDQAIIKTRIELGMK